MIGTVRNVGYKFVRPTRGQLGVPAAGVLDDDSDDDSDDSDRAGRPTALGRA